VKHVEDNLQIACVTWIKLQYPDVVCFAIPNGGKRNAIEAARMKKTGTLAGVADLFVMKSTIVKTDDEIFGYDLMHGLFIELKAGKNGQTEAQKEFQNKAIKARYAYHVCLSLDEFMGVVNDYLK